MKKQKEVWLNADWFDSNEEHLILVEAFRRYRAMNRQFCYIFEQPPASGIDIEYLDKANDDIVRVSFSRSEICYPYNKPFFSTKINSKKLFNRRMN